jgi:type I restriction enzyme, R subunit
MTEDQLEQETLGWLSELGYAVHSGYDIAYDGPNPQRANYREVVLAGRLRDAIQRLNPKVPTAARKDALPRLISGQLRLPEVSHVLQEAGVA